MSVKKEQHGSSRLLLSVVTQIYSLHMKVKTSALQSICVEKEMLEKKHKNYNMGYDEWHAIAEMTYLSIKTLEN